MAFTWAEVLSEDPEWLRARRRLGLSTKINVKVSSSHGEAMHWCELQQRQRDDRPNTFTVEVDGVLFSAVYPRWMPRDTERWPTAWAWFVFCVHDHARRRAGLTADEMPVTEMVIQNLSTGQTYERGVI